MVELPVIDIGPLVTSGPSFGPEVTRVASAIDAACREVGFFVVVGHGVDPELITRLHGSARRFFALPEAAKAEIAMARGGRAWRGWFPVGGELTSGIPDGKEGVYFGAELGADHPAVVEGRPLHGPNLFPAQVPELRSAVLDYLLALERVGQAVLSGMAIGLGLGPGWFREHVTHDPLVLFRLFRYPPRPRAGGGWGVAEHTDYGLLTLLGQDGVGGLQVHGGSGWIDVDARPDAFVCNLGDMLERLTGGRYVSTPHRVRNATTADRLSFPFFLDPGWDTMVEPAVLGAASVGRRARWDHADVHGEVGTYGDYITAKVAKVFPALANDGRSG